MFDFRYHALSLAAVFLALGIGIVLGVTIGDSLVSETDRSLRRSLRGDVLEARDAEERAQAQLRQRDALVNAAFPYLADERLGGEDVAVVALGALPDDVENRVREAVEEAGGSVDSVTELGAPPDLAELGEDLGRRFADVADDEDRAERLGARLGRSLARGGRLARRLENALPDRFQGDYREIDSVVVWRETAEERSDAADSFESALLQALVEAPRPVVGVEETGTEPSQIGFFGDHEMSSVDNVDQVGGQAALVLALDGAEGRFGVKESAEGPLPGGD